MEQCTGQEKEKTVHSCCDLSSLSSHFHVFNLKPYIRCFNLKLRAVWQRWLAYQRFIPSLSSGSVLLESGSLVKLHFHSTAPQFLHLEVSERVFKCFVGLEYKK